MEGSLVKQVLEDAMQFALVDGSTGHSLYGAGIRYEANEIPNAEGKRLVSVEVLNKQTQQWEPIDDNKRYLVGTNAYVVAVKMVTKLLVNYLTIRNMKALIPLCLMRKVSLNL